ncbi:MAG: peptidoglycan DD-metalloendopeptidase family protein [Pseudomonadales bacterium]|nr:peptidoglycan DD-metalloendopeptidase family protein [Pseudomonadales bacterium]
MRRPSKKISWRGIGRFPLLCFVCLYLFACSSHDYVPLQDRYRTRGPVTTGVHTVLKGETLFAIAWKYHRDFKELARVNGIKAPYDIRPGQRISLAKPATKVTNSNKNKTPVSNRSKTPSYKKPKNDAKPIQEKVANQEDKKVNISWSWPAGGSLLKNFSSRGKVNKGITIAGKRGEAVYAAASGEVVYSGPGFVGYGNLVIIKHSKTVLSAYAHNSRLLVKEGQKVKVRQKIAEIGSTGATRNQLYFEIRRSGKPVDPMRYLPKR